MVSTSTGGRRRTAASMAPLVLDLVAGLGLSLLALTHHVSASAAANTGPHTFPGRQSVNFDFGWRHYLGDPTPRQCGEIKVGYNYGTGGTAVHGIPDAPTCCDRCAAAQDCVAWDWNPTTLDCWLKQDASGPVAANRSTGVIPPPAWPPAASQPGFDDSEWLGVDAPHDMLIAQQYSETEGDPKYAFLPRGEGWYRKHFSLPTEWRDTDTVNAADASAVYIVFEGVYHVTTAWLNGVQLDGGNSHLAGYTSFALRIDGVPGLAYSDDVAAGVADANVLALHVDASFGTNWWYAGGGLMRHYHIVRVPSTAASLGAFGQGVFAYGANLTGIAGDPGAGGLKAAAGKLNAMATVTNIGSQAAVGGQVVSVRLPASRAASTVSARFTLYDATGAPVGSPTTTPAMPAPAGTNDTATLSTVIDVSDVNLWSVPRPYLYTLVTDILYASGAGAPATVVDTVNVTSLGFRSVNFTADEGLFLNGYHVKVRGFCDHSNFGGVGAAVPDRVNLFRVQALRAVGANSWRMAHNPPIPARLDFTDALGMTVLDENRNYGGTDGQGGFSRQTGWQQVADMGDLVQRDRNRASVMAWSFCNEVGCDNETWAGAFRNISEVFDGTRAVTQNHLGTITSTQFLDIQGFSHKQGSDFDDFHAKYPTKPTMATECCSCLSQRGVDEDSCPKPRPSSCTQGCRVDCQGSYSGDDTDGVFYNNEVSQCTATQVARSDGRDFVSGTFVWSGYDYLGESRGWPQTAKCRGTVADVAGFPKETSQWFKAWWLANISASDAGRPAVDVDTAYVVYVPESWAPPQGAAKGDSTRLIHAYTNAASVALLLNGKPAAGGDRQDMPYFGTATWDNVTYAAGNLTAVGYDASGAVVATYTLLSAGAPAALRLSLDAPSPHTGTGNALVADGEDTAMVRAEVVDANGVMVPGAANNITFTVTSGGNGRIWATHNGDPASQVHAGSPWHPAYHGLARAFVRSSVDAATPAWHRRLLAQIDADTAASNVRVVPPPPHNSGSDRAVHASAAAVAPIVVQASSPGLSTATLSIPVTTDLSELPLAVALREGQRRVL